MHGAGSHMRISRLARTGWIDVCLCGPACGERCGSGDGGGGSGVPAGVAPHCCADGEHALPQNCDIWHPMQHSSWVLQMHLNGACIRGSFDTRKPMCHLKPVTVQTWAACTCYQRAKKCLAQSVRVSSKYMRLQNGTCTDAQILTHWHASLWPE